MLLAVFFLENVCVCVCVCMYISVYTILYPPGYSHEHKPEKLMNSCQY